MKAVGIPVANQLVGAGSGNDSLTGLVGAWPQIKSVLAAGLIRLGPRRSGVYARFTGPRGGSLQLLDARGAVARTLGVGAGLIAATRDNVSQPIWLITGTDGAGVGAAAAALSPARLRDHFALAVQAGAVWPVPFPAQ